MVGVIAGPLLLSLHGEADTSYFDFFSAEDAQEPIPKFDSDSDKRRRLGRANSSGINAAADGGGDPSEGDLTSFSFSNF